ncbi:LPXTG cell wall anchor domain-containing protein [Glycomyces tenuis]|uniref:LPXTG cell wall anchor domain-containing protein n=1 Tax=Glycomyces tenuis TaxID=58116 RepID=UPI0003FFEAEF|nr:LPXTG cell wall anchor domain-containing protein [Glycomyces tenuis]
MSILKSKSLRGVAVAGVATGIVAAWAGSASAQGTVIVAEATIYLPSAVVVGSNPVELTMTPTTDEAVNNSVVTLTPDDPTVLDFNPAGDDRCVDGDAGTLVCTIDGVLPADGATLNLSADVLEGANEESDLGFGLVFSADDVESATMHTGLALGSTDLVDNPAPEPEEPTEEPSDEPSDDPSEDEGDDAEPTDDAQEQLPATGGNTGIMIGAAAAVALAGVGAVLIARRRKAAEGWE